MISIDFHVNIEDFPLKEVGDYTLVRVYASKFQFDVTNDGRKPLRGLNVRPVLESYVGQEKPQLYQWQDTQVIDEILPNQMVPLKVEFVPRFVGLVAVALYVTDADNKAVMAKRITDSSYVEAPVRWWFNVADDILLEILGELRKLVARGGKTKE